MESHKDLQGPNSNEIGHSIEHFDLYYEVFGPGSSTLDVAIPALFRQTCIHGGPDSVQPESVDLSLVLTRNKTV